MTSTDAADPHWGERNVARRTRRRFTLGALGVAASLGFGLAGHYVVSLGSFVAPPGEAADAGSLIWAIALLAVAAIVFRLLWRAIDEVQRRHLVNATAVAGVASMGLIVLVQAAGKLLPVTEPMMAVLIGSAAALVAAIIVQRLRR